MEPDFIGTRVLILGLGVIGGGVGMVKHLAARGARLRITDLRTAGELSPALEALDGIDAEYVLGEHREDDIRWADLVVRNPAVPPGSPLLRLARELGTPVEMELSYFTRYCPARITAVTGTKGKTTTTTLLGQLLLSGSVPSERVYLAGNMGVSAVRLLDTLTAQDQVVLEISCQQLEGRREVGWSPDIAVVTNVADDHIERYGSMAEYRRVKASLVKGQTASGWAILPGWDLELAVLGAEAPSRKVFVHDPSRPFSAEAMDHAAVVTVDSDRVRWTGPGSGNVVLAEFAEFGLLGRHNQVNLAFAAAAAYVAGRTPEEIARTIPLLRPPEHRLQPVATWGEITFINDTAATAPIAVTAALEALSDEKVVLICGGTGKGSDFSPMIEAIERSVAAVVLLPGSGTDEIAPLLSPRRVSVTHAATMADAVDHAIELAHRTGSSCVALSPGCASFGLFRNEFHRGQAFIDAVHAACPG